MYLVLSDKDDNIFGMSLSGEAFLPWRGGLLDNLQDARDPENSICKVFQITQSVPFNSLSGYLKLIWERKEPPKEVSSKEAFNILKGHFGTDVKIIED